MKLMCWAMLAVLAGGQGAHAEGYARVLSYRSPVDGSDQAYGVYVPDREAPVSGYPVVLHAHGYGWSVSSGFSAWQKAYADAQGWLLVQLNGRGPNFYWGIGDVATGEVVDDLDRRFGVDRRRVFITGGSMGGTGAYRQGVVHPDQFAAAVGVDGWTDFREWHWHYYSRKDQDADIEEFRRPLLEVASPLYLAERARWNDVYVIADGRDNVVYPTQAIDMYARLQELGSLEPGAYLSGISFNPDKGHGGGTDLQQTYDYFAGRVGNPKPGSLRIVSPVLDHGELYWARMESQHLSGERMLLEAWCELGARPPAVHVQTANLDGLALHLPLSPVADAPEVEVLVDGLPAYRGAPAEVRLEAERDGDDRIVAWEEAQAPRTGLRKTPELCGPLGQAFVQPFLVCYGTIGDAEAQRRHREEAVAFAKGWNDFMVHGPGVEAVAEDALEPWQIERANLVVYGSLETSRLLRRAQGIAAIPVEVHEDRILVRDPLHGDRDYRGAKFGCFLAYPNPLTEGRTYLVVCDGRYATQPNGTELRGLEYDLEKLAWGYSDYVVFNTNLRELPHVMNVNNKPPVTCYEPGYFVEAGYFDARWGPDRGSVVERVRRTKPANVRLVHVADVKVAQTDQSLPAFERVDGEPTDPVRTKLAAPVWAATVKVVDSGGNPVRQARVTGMWDAVGTEALSAVSMSDGVAYFAAPAGAGATTRFTVLNVMATGAEYDFEADCSTGSLLEDGHGLCVRPRPARMTLESDLPVTVRAEVGNTGREGKRVVVRWLPPFGMMGGDPVAVRLAPGETTTVALRWLPEDGHPGGAFTGAVQVECEGVVVSRPVALQVAAPRKTPLRLVAMSGKHLYGGDDYLIKAKVYNTDFVDAQTVRLACNLVESGRRLPVQEATIGPRGAVEFQWRPEPGEEPLAKGEHHARVVALNAPGVTDVAGFVVRALRPE
jgi:hypothetical protein